ncbi:uncharacterized protein EV154DRAFT_606719 [Mucor mucedo]|uniref:uncharacterized protein n=1 Tax=Mucor mucedo TaxID=29922 RepID=UPI00221E5F12|nr:uncharacterized protein EV154DRAFT_606719 [Mucor mucedo]KAI7876315.1 hypothetical protein EV154DRAFT_606719 [Mucor mucedo]
MPVSNFCLPGDHYALDLGGPLNTTSIIDLADGMGFDHRFITPLHASANGISERYVQSVKRLLSKATRDVGDDWDLHLNAVHEQRKPKSEEELIKRIDYMTDIVFPAYTAKTMAQIIIEKAKFDNKHQLVEYPPCRI